MEFRHKDQTDYKAFIHRFEHAVVYRLKDKTRIKEAMELQDKIRSLTKGGVNLTKEIRKWRDKG